MRIEETIINVMFDAAKGDVSVSSREAVVGKPLGELPQPNRQGFAFAGWYLGDELVTADTLIEANDDIRLVAHWVKKAGSKKVTMYRKQKIAVAVLAILTVVLIVALLAVNHIVSIYTLEDIYYDDNGAEYSEKYYIKKKDGAYALYDKDGAKMEVNSDGYYIAKSGNQYEINAETGEFSLYAVVDYDSLGGETLGFSDRIMMFPQIKQSDISFIEVTNQVDSYKFYRDDDGYVKIEGTEDAVVNYDATLYASLCVSTGYMLTMQKLDLSSKQAPRLDDGSIDYAAYGLVDLYDAEGNKTYSPTRYTIGGKHLKDINGDGTIRTDEYVYAEYTVLVGDAIVSDGGYYVQLEKGVLTADGYHKEMGKRDAVYIVSADIQDTVLQPVEALVTPMIVYPTTMNQYLMVEEFVLGKANMKDSLADPEKAELDIITAFSFEDMESRLNTVYSASPYISHEELMKGYVINDNNASGVLGNMYQMEFIACRELGLKGMDKELMAKYGLDKDVYYMAYLSPMVDSNGAPVTDENGDQVYADNKLIISPKTPQGTYYVASILCDMIVEVDQYYMSFLEWEKSDWYNKYFFSNNLAYITDFEFTMGNKSYSFELDNSLSYAYYKTASGKWSVLDLEKGSVEKLANGSYVYTDKDGNKHTPKIVDFSNTDAFVFENQKLYYVDSDGKYEITLGVSNIYPYCQQYTEGKEHPNLLDYVINHTYITDSGTQKTERITGIGNFRSFYQRFLWFTIEGDVNEKEFEENMGMSVQDYIALGDDVCQATIKYRMKDYASVMNHYTYTDEKGETVKLWTEDNESDVVIRFYRYSERKSMLTIEIIEDYDENGNPISDPTKAVGAFYVLSSYLDTLAAEGDRLLNKEIVTND